MHNKCRPIKKQSLIVNWEQAIKEGIRRGEYTERQYLFFLLALGTGLNYDELAQIKYEDLKLSNEKINSSGPPVEIMYILLESKRYPEKTRRIIFPDNCRKMIKELIKENPNDVYLFQSKMFGYENRPAIYWAPEYIRKFLQKSAKESGMPTESFGASMLRKTFGYFQLKYSKWTLRELQQYFEMRSINLLKEYLDITDEFD
jgi:integrase